MKYAVERFKEELSVLNKTIWEAAEIKYEEYRSEAAVIEVLRKHGFRLEEQVADIPTAFRAVYGSGRHSDRLRMPGRRRRERKDDHGGSRSL